MVLITTFKKNSVTVKFVKQLWAWCYYQLFHVRAMGHVVLHAHEKSSSGALA